MYSKTIEGTAIGKTALERVLAFLRAVSPLEFVNALLMAILFLLLFYLAFVLWAYFSTYQEIPDYQNPYRRRVKPAYSWKWEWEVVS